VSQHRILGPESSESSFIEFGAVLNGVEYQFALQWLEVVEFWELTITDPRRQTVINGMRVTGNTDLPQPYNDMPRLPPGRLVAYDTTGASMDPGREDWIERHLFIYEDPIVVTHESFVRIIPAVFA